MAENLGKHQVQLAIDGMHCGACVRRVTLALEKTPGVTVKSVAIGSATVETDAAGGAAVLAAMQKAGYPAKLAQTT